MTRPTSIWRRPLWIALPLLVLSVSALLPFGLDISVYHSMATELVRFGRPPYLGSIDQNLPGGMFVQLVAVALFGPSELAYRLTDLAFLLAASLILYRVWMRWLEPQASLIAVLLFDLYLVRCGTYVLGQRDVYAGVLVVIAGAVALDLDRIPLRRALYSGLLLGAATLIRPTYILYVPLVPLAVRSMRGRSALAMLFAASALPCAVFLGVYAMIPNGLPEIFRLTVLANRDLYTKFSGPFKWFILNTTYVPFFVVIPAAAWIAVRWVRERSRTIRPIRNDERMLYWMFFGLTVLLILVQRKFLPYHFAPYVLLLAPLGALGLEGLLRFLRPALRLTVIVVLGIAVCWPIGALYSAANRSLADGSNFVQDFRSRIDPDPFVGYDRQHEVLDYLNSPEYRDKSVEVVGFDARLRALVARRSPTRFTQIHLLGYRLDPDAPESEAGHPEYQRRWRREFVDSIQNAGVIVIARHTHSWYLHDPYDVLHSLPGFDSLLSAGYRLDTTIGAFDIFSRRP